MYTRASMNRGLGVLVCIQLMGCGGAVEHLDRRDGGSGDSVAADEAPALDLTATQYTDLVTSIRNVGILADATAAKIRESADGCSKASSERRRILEVMAPLASQVVSLQLQSSSLGDLIRIKTTDIDARQGYLSGLQGQYEAYKFLTAYWSSYTAISGQVAKYDSVIATTKSELAAVTSRMAYLLRASSFDAVAYGGMDKQQVELVGRIVFLSKARAVLADAVAAILAQRPWTPNSFPSTINSLATTISNVTPAVVSDVEAWRGQRLQLVQSKWAVDQEIMRDASAQKLQVPAVPAECSKFGY